MDRARRLLALLVRSTRRLVVLVVGTTVTLAGVVMLVTPGPGLVVILAGLAILATEFTWAEILLDRAKRQALKARDAAVRQAGGLRRTVVEVVEVGELVSSGPNGDAPETVAVVETLKAFETVETLDLTETVDTVAIVDLTEAAPPSGTPSQAATEPDNPAIVDLTEAATAGSADPVDHDPAHGRRDHHHGDGRGTDAAPHCSRTSGQSATRRRH